MRHKGRVTEWRDDQGFGFIAPSLGGERVFLHIRSFSERNRRPAQNDLVTYELTFDERRRPRASQVRFSSDSAPNKTSSSPKAARTSESGWPLAAAVALFGLVGAAVFAGRLSFAVLVLYLGASVVAFVAYWLDKSAARRGRWRTAEGTLHLIGLLGGWPGALFAQRLWRHKTRKAEFQQVFWATVILNCAALGWLLSGKGAALLAGQ